jgi:hypothetical protein
MSDILPKMGDKIIIDDDVSRVLPLLPLTKMQGQ